MINFEIFQEFSNPVQVKSVTCTQSNTFNVTVASLRMTATSFIIISFV